MNERDFMKTIMDMEVEQERIKSQVLADGEKALMPFRKKAAVSGLQRWESVQPSF